MMDFTPWFLGKDKPTRIGVYQRFYTGMILYCYYDGKRWSMGTENLLEAVNLKQWAANNQNVPWRGLLSDHSIIK